MLEAKSISTVATLDGGESSLAKTSLKGRFFWALLVFAVLSRSLAAVHFGLPAASESNNKTWTAWAVDDFSRLTAAPSVVLLGSSLVLTPVNLADAQDLDRTLDGSQHHESALYSRLVKKLTGRKTLTFNFALPGEMPSDAYLISKLLLNDSKKPALIVYGVGPRDFMDNLLSSPSATDPYRYLSKIVSGSREKDYLDHTWESQLDRLLSRIIYSYGKREDLADGFHKCLNVAFNRALPEQRKTNAEIHTLCPQYNPMAIEPGECLFNPIGVHGPAAFKDNIEEYRKRYGTLKWTTFLEQLNFLAKFIDLTRAHHIDVVIVAMPITSTNRRLIPNLTWNAYNQSLRVLSKCKGARFIDLEESKQFSDKDFGDTVHLNTIGGIKLVQLIVANILQQEKSKSNDERLGQLFVKQAGAAL